MSRPILGILAFGWNKMLSTDITSRREDGTQLELTTGQQAKKKKTTFKLSISGSVELNFASATKKIHDMFTWTLYSGLMSKSCCITFQPRFTQENTFRSIKS